MSFLDRSKDVRQGHARWERAVNNYNKHRGDHGEKLFAARMAAANAAVDELGFDAGPYTFWEATDLMHRWNDVTGHSEWTWRDPENRTWQRKHYACTTFCAGLQATLDFSNSLCERPEPRKPVDTTNINHIYLIDVLQSEEFNTSNMKVTHGAPVKGAKCRVCGRTIYADGQLGGDPLVDFPVEAKAYDPAFTSSFRIETAGSIHDGKTTVLDFTEGTTPYAVDGQGTVIALEEIRVVRLTDREAELFLEVSDSERTRFAVKYGIPLGL